MEFLGMWKYILLPSTDSFPPETRCQRELHSPTMIYPQPMASFIWQIMMRGYFRCDCLGHFFLCGPNMIMRFFKAPPNVPKLGWVFTISSNRIIWPSSFTKETPGITRILLGFDPGHHLVRFLIYGLASSSRHGPWRDHRDSPVFTMIDSLKSHEITMKSPILMVI
jgi:hypothetical protein